MKHNENGITLIALIVVIIVLLILASTSISVIVGDDGIESKSAKAVEMSSEANVIEDVEAAWYSLVIGYNYNIDVEEYYTQVALNKRLETGVASDYTYVEDGNTTFIYTENLNGNQYKVSISPSGKAKIVETIGQSTDD